MKAKTFEDQYNVIDFNLYLDNIEDEKETISVVDFVLESDDIDFIKNEFNNIFMIEGDKLSYLFSGYELTECYKVGDGLIRVICVK